MEKSNASLIRFYVFYIFDVSMRHDFESLHFSKCFPYPVYGAGAVCMRCMYVVNMCVCVYICVPVCITWGSQRTLCAEISAIFP